MSDVMEIWDEKVEVFVTRYIEKNYSGDHRRVRVLESAQVGRIYYAALQVYNLENGVMTVDGLACIADLFHDNGKRMLEFKPISETSGPSYSDCPLSIIKLLTSPPNKYAAEWRAQCIAKALRPKFKVAPSDVVVFSEPFTTPEGECTHFFINGKDKTYWLVSNYFGSGTIYKLKNRVLKEAFDIGELKIVSGEAKARLENPNTQNQNSAPSPTP